VLLYAYHLTGDDSHARFLHKNAFQKAYAQRRARGRVPKTRAWLLRAVYDDAPELAHDHQAFALRYSCGLSRSQIAWVLGEPPAEVDRLITRATGGVPQRRLARWLRVPPRRRRFATISEAAVAHGQAEVASALAAQTPGFDAAAAVRRRVADGVPAATTLFKILSVTAVAGAAGAAGAILDRHFVLADPVPNRAVHHPHGAAGTTVQPTLFPETASWTPRSRPGGHGHLAGPPTRIG
jgi:hypothetical protein